MPVLPDPTGDIDAFDRAQLAGVYGVGEEIVDVDLIYRYQRASSISLGRVWMPLLPYPDGSIIERDRAQLAWSYDIHLLVDPTLAIGLMHALFEAQSQAMTFTATPPAMTFDAAPPDMHFTTEDE